ncbi:POK10 protein, partial [Oreotrochilus melanogaster]|nr:POK10 protein [Oreotrochilus melanogaster]
LMAEGNKIAELLAAVVHVPDLSQQAHLSHEFYCQSASALKCSFHLTQEQACQIVVVCPDCQLLQPLLHVGSNPQGLNTLQIWQMDVTHITEFGHLKYVHDSTDTFSLCLHILGK